MTSFPVTLCRLVRTQLCTVPYRGRKLWLRSYLMDLWERRQLVGPVEPKPRLTQPNWNYDAELYAFSHRVGEQFSENNLRRAFLHRSYVENEEEERERLLASSGTENKSTSAIIGVEHNEDLYQIGVPFISKYVKGYLRLHMPKYPEEGIVAVHDYLTATEKLVIIAKYLGAYDLILATNFPYAEEIVARTLQALVGALILDGGEKTAGHFVQDFLLTQLVVEDVNELWYFKDPWGILCAYAKAEGLGQPEPRILRQAGCNTVTPVYVVGIYSDETLIASSAGESEQIAVEMASRESLKHLWMSNNVQFKFGAKGRSLDVEGLFDRPNWSIQERLGIKVALDPTLYDEPLTAEQMTVQYKEMVEKTIGTPYRRRLKHRFYPGTLLRKMPRRFIAPKPTSI